MCSPAREDLDEVTIELSDRVKLIPGGIGRNWQIFRSRPQFTYFRKDAGDGRKPRFYADPDTAAGIAENVSGILASASRSSSSSRPEPTSIVDAYATIKTYSPAFTDQTNSGRCQQYCRRRRGRAGFSIDQRGRKRISGP